MKIESYLTDGAVLSELGARLERTRLARNLTQRQLAQEAGVERKVVARIEAGESVKLTSFVRVLRVLGLLDTLDQLVPPPLPSPIDLLTRHDKTRRRASGQRRKGAPATDQVAQWHWGDEAPRGGA